MVGNQPSSVSALATEVLPGDLLSPHVDLSGMPDRCGVPVRPADLQFQRGKGPADRPEPGAHGRVVAAVGCSVVLGPEHGDRRARLRQAVGVDEADVREQIHRPLDDRDGHPPTAVGEVGQCGETGTRGVEGVQDPTEHRRHDHGVSDLLGLGQTDPLDRVELRQVDDPPPAVRAGEDGGDPCDVVGRHAHQRGLFLTGGHEVD